MSGLELPVCPVEVGSFAPICSPDQSSSKQREREPLSAQSTAPVTQSCGGEGEGNDAGCGSNATNAHCSEI